MSQKQVSWKVTPLFLLFLTFLVLKLTGHITWSWWWVTAPLWGGAALCLVIVIIAVLAIAAKSSTR
jgi:hypothetical protein